MSRQHPLFALGFAPFVSILFGLFAVGCTSDVGDSPARGSGGSSGGGGTGSAGAGGSGTGATSGGGGASGNAASGGSGLAANGGSAGTSGSAGNGGSAGASGTGAAGGSGGASGSGGGSGGSSGIGCDRQELIFCEDFESTNVGAIPPGWSSQGSVSVADDEARGQRSLKIGAADNGARWIYRAAESLGSAHWGRVYYRVQTPTPGVFVHSTLVELNGDGPDLGNAWYRVVDTVQDAQRRHQFLYNVQPETSGEFGKGSSYDWQFDGQWHCAEWFIDGNTQAYRFYLDEQEIAQIQIQNGPGNYGSGADRTHIPTSFARLSVGWNNYQSAPPGFVAWIDDLATSAERVGCD